MNTPKTLPHLPEARRKQAKTKHRSLTIKYNQQQQKYKQQLATTLASCEDPTDYYSGV